VTVAAHQVGLTRRWLEEGRRLVVATLVEADGSSPFEPGAFVLVTDDGAVEGSITGGCVESDVVLQAEEILATHGPARMVTYGVSDELATSVGLMCGGTVHVLIGEVRGADRETLATAFAAVERDEPVGLATRLDGPEAGAALALVGNEPVGGLRGGDLLDNNVEGELRGALRRAGSRVRRFGAGGETLGDAQRVHVQSFLPPPTMLIVGAIDYAAALAPLAKAVGYDVVIADARQTFAASSRFARAAEVRIGWPQEIVPEAELSERDALLVFSHDPKFDEPAILAALASDVGYIGTLGSRRTTADRRRRLAEAGVPDEQLDRLHAPCGLDIGAATPEEVAVSILAEIISVRTGRAGGPLRGGSGPIRDR